MNLVEEHNKKYDFFREITGVAMKVYNKYRPGYNAPQGLFSEWYERDNYGSIEKIKLF